VVVLRRQEDLGLVAESAKRLGVKDAITVSLEGSSKLVGLFCDLPALAGR
jgi:hypothetical protein